MKYIKLVFIFLGLAVLAACSSKNDGGTTTTVNPNGLAINSASKALDSLNNLVPSSFVSRGGVPTDYCNTNGIPKKTNGDLMTDDVVEIAAGYGFCQATYNSQSPDTAQGSMYIAGGMACEAALAGLFDNLSTGGAGENTVTKDITFNTTCWGNQAQVDAFIADAGSSTIEDVVMTVEEVSGSTAYDFKVSFVITGMGTIEVYTLNNSTTSAALNATDGWAFRLDKASGTINYESIDTDNNRWVRLIVNGSLTTSGTYSELESVLGFQLESNNRIYSFHGDLTEGIMGDYAGLGGDPDFSDQCYLPGGTESCSGVGIDVVDADVTALAGNIATANTNLKAYTGTILTITTIDPTDTDITL